MRKHRMLIYALVAVASSSALVASSARAEWFVAGTKLASGSKMAIAPISVTEKPAVFSVPLLGIKITCNSEILTASGAEIVGPNVIKAHGLGFEGCETTEPKTGCELENQPTALTSVPVTGTETKGAKEPEDSIVLEPQTKKAFIEIPFKEENTCAAAGSQVLMGKVSFTAPTGQDSVAEQQIAAIGTKSSGLTMGGDPVYIERGSFGFGGLENAPWGTVIAEKTIPWLTATPDPLQFKTMGETLTVTLMNKEAGTETHALPPASIPNNGYLYPPNFTITKDGCEGHILKGHDLNSCAIEVKFSAPGSGSRELIIREYLHLTILR